VNGRGVPSSIGVITSSKNSSTLSSVRIGNTWSASLRMKAVFERLDR